MDEASEAPDKHYPTVFNEIYTRRMQARHKKEEAYKMLLEFAAVSQVLRDGNALPPTLTGKLLALRSTLMTRLEDALP